MSVPLVATRGDGRPRGEFERHFWRVLGAAAAVPVLASGAQLARDGCNPPVACLGIGCLDRRLSMYIGGGLLVLILIILLLIILL